jgi:hypothetical protein
LLSHGGTTLILAGDETTWLGGGLRCRCNRVEDPLTEEEGARDLVVIVERGMDNPKALGCGSRKKPTQRNRRMKPNL